MSFFNRLTAVIVSCALLGPITPLEARTKKGDKYLAEGRTHEAKKEWDEALESFEKAQSEDPGETLYQIAAEKGRAQAAQAHVEAGLKIRAKGQLGEALLEFQKAYAIYPGSFVAAQEVRDTQVMIGRERQRVEQTGKEAPPEVRALTPAEASARDEDAKISRMLPIPELRPMGSGLVDLKMNGKVKTIFETLGKYAGINVLWDPEYTTPSHDSFTVAFDNTTLDQALDYIALQSKSFWKAISPNTIFITNDSINKRRDYEEQVMQTFYLHNITTQTEMQEVMNAVRTLPDLAKVFQDLEQYAIVVRGEADKVALAGKIIHDLDRGRPEVLVDILILEASTIFNKQITAAIASTGLNVPFNFSPRSSIQVQGNSSTSTTTTNTASTSNTANTTNLPASTASGTLSGVTPSTTSGLAIPLSSLGHIASSDYSVSLPSALLQAAMSDAKTTVLQAPELRATEGIKSVLNIGEREPTASGSFQPGIGGVGINPLVNTQFQYIDIGVNVELTARVHSDNEVSMHLLLNLTTIAGNVNLGGITQPIIGQRKVEHEVRMKEGEVAIVGGLVTRQDDKTVTGIPGLSSIPLFGNLFKGSTVDHNRDDVIIVVIPHIIRKADFREDDLRPIAVGNAQTVKINYAPKASDIISPSAAPLGAPIGEKPAAPGQPAAGTTGAPGATGATTTPPLTPALPPGLPLTPGLTTNTPPGGAIAPPATAPPMPALPATAQTATSTAAGTALLRFAPAPVQTSVGSTFSVSLMLDNAANVSTAPVQVLFDPKVLKLNDISPGDLLSQGGVAAMITKNIQNDAGAAAVQVGRPPSAPGASGSGTLITLNFSAIAPGNTQITAPNVMLRDSQGANAGSGSPQLSVTVK